MNELVRTLAEEAANQYLATTMPLNGTVSTSRRNEILAQAKEMRISIIPDAFLEQYTKLIVQECFTKLEPYIDEFSIADVKLELNGHFGLKE